MALLTIHYPSKVLHMNTTMTAILPDEPSKRPGGLYQTLYLLHGYSGDHTDWTRRTLIERYALPYGIAVIMPSAHNSFYTELPGRGRYFTHISQEIPALAERMFPLSRRREDRFCAGLSMGGYGAFKMALHGPDQFAAAISLSGAVDIVGLMEKGKNQVTETPFEGIYTSADAARGGPDDLISVARRLLLSKDPLPRLYAACGTEDFLYENNQGFLSALPDLPITYEEGPGDHTWDFWDAYIKRALAWLLD